MIISTLGILSCSQEEIAIDTQFQSMDNAQMGITFSNDLPYTEEFNTYTYRNFYNGGGVALGDINNDGWTDILFTGNIMDNKLYLNNGDWTFTDITEQAGVQCSGVWCTGASMVDINADGLLDIYVCKAGKPGGDRRHNELFINNGDLTYTERAAEYGLDVEGLSIHSAFFDYDKDGDLDCYLLNNSIRSVGGFDLIKDQRNNPDPEGNKFFRNDDGVFTEVQNDIGIYSSNIGYGLGITLSDVNADGWTDIFISNDFFEKDYLYINNQDGTFTEEGEERMSSMSMGSMGADASDINNDLRPDLFVTEMLPADVKRKRTKAQYESWDKYTASLKKGYHHQFSRNAFHVNVGEGKFFEISRAAGVDATEWSWASLIQDFDNDGLKDIVVSNGIYKDLLDKDYLNYFANKEMVKSRIDNNEKVLTVLIDSMPSSPVPNCYFKNQGDFKFEEIADQVGLGAPSFSNGSAYGDLDNDGDLDLIFSNANGQPSIYRNTIDTAQFRSVQFTLKGLQKNSHAIGSKIYAYGCGQQYLLEHFTSKGFQSTVDHKLLIGVGRCMQLDSVIIVWPDGSSKRLFNLKSNGHYTIEQAQDDWSAEKSTANLKRPTLSYPFDYVHLERDINLFTRERMLIEMSGADGPAIAVADFNKDEIEDVFIGGGKGQSSAIYLSKSGKYTEQTQAFSLQKKKEVTCVIAADLDKDGDTDLYVGHGGPTSPAYGNAMDDVIYLNDGYGQFKEVKIPFKSAIYTSAVAVDNSKDKPIIAISEKLKPNRFGQPCSTFILHLTSLEDIKVMELPQSETPTMWESIQIGDINKDGITDVIGVGKWTPLTIWTGTSTGGFNTPYSVSNSKGIWTSSQLVDVNKDGLLDLVCGNVGLNSPYRPKMQMHINDFDKNGMSEQIISIEEDGLHYPIHDLDEMYSQLPYLKKKYPYYKDVSVAPLEELFSEQQLDDAIKYELDVVESSIFINKGNLNFDRVALPVELQFSSIQAIYADTTLGDETKILFGGNDYRVKPQFGRYDASKGWSLKVNKNLNYTEPKSLEIDGQIRSIAPYQDGVLIGVNGEKIIKLEHEE